MARGGKREGAGRKKVSVKSYAFRAPKKVVDILDKKNSITEYICDAILYYEEHRGGCSSCESECEI